MRIPKPTAGDLGEEDSGHPVLAASQSLLDDVLLCTPYSPLSNGMAEEVVAEYYLAG